MKVKVHQIWHENGKGWNVRIVEVWGAGSVSYMFAKIEDAQYFYDSLSESGQKGNTAESLLDCWRGGKDMKSFLNEFSFHPECQTKKVPIESNVRLDDIPFNKEENQRLAETISNIGNLITPYKPLLNYTVSEVQDMMSGMDALLEIIRVHEARVRAEEEKKS